MVEGEKKTQKRWDVTTSLSDTTVRTLNRYCNAMNIPAGPVIDEAVEVFIEKAILEGRYKPE